jgi:hypothetical protein
MIVRNERHFCAPSHARNPRRHRQSCNNNRTYEEQASSLWQALAATPEDQPGFHAAHVAYYLGALIVAGAMGWFVTMAFDRLSGGMLSLIALAYAAVALLAARYFWNRSDLRILGGICATVAVCMTPLAIFGVEKALNLWPAGVSGARADVKDEQQRQSSQTP